MVENTFPEDRELAEPERLRLFRKDVPRLKRVSKKLGLEDDEVKRRAVHVGLKELAEVLGIDDPAEKKAA